jgi:hypothetical protein
MAKPKRFTIEEIIQADHDQQGFCIACGYQQDGCEPDARRYKCEDCERPYVYGAAELTLMGLVD